ncbi:MAG: GatB/YqeY domain-containing protein, partial [Mesorhizobium sp.]
LKSAMKAQDKRRLPTLRLIQAAIHDRDIANRGAGKEPASDDEILQILAKMVKQREESAKAFDDGKRPELAAQERDEMAIIRDFLPTQLG